MSASPTTAASAAANGPVTRTTLESVTQPSGTLATGGTGAAARSLMTMKPQRPAPSAPHDPEAGVRLRVAVDDDVLEQVAERRLDGAFVLRLHLEVVGQRAALPDRTHRRWPAASARRR